MSEMLPLGEGLFPPMGSMRIRHKISKLAPLKDKVLVRDMNFSGRKLSSGIVLLGDDRTTAGIRPRWAQVYAVGPDIYVMGQIRVKGQYSNRICQPAGFINTDISTVASFKQLCAEKIATCVDNSCWVGGDTGGWFGIQPPN